MKVRKEELIEKIKKSIKLLQYSIDEIEEELSDLQSHWEDADRDLGTLEDLLDEISEEDTEEFELEGEFSPSQEKTLKELGLEDKIKEQKDMHIILEDII
jgi:hypothetical protein